MKRGKKRRTKAGKKGEESNINIEQRIEVEMRMAERL